MPQLLRVDRLPTSEHRNELLDSALPGVEQARFAVVIRYRIEYRLAALSLANMALARSGYRAEAKSAGTSILAWLS